MPSDSSQLAARILHLIPAIIAYIDTELRCVFINDASREWLGRNPPEAVGRHVSELLGPLYERNLPYMQRALSGEKQVFERQISSPDDVVREAVVTYSPDIVNGIVRGFVAHVMDVTILREREMTLENVIRERDAAQAELRILHGLLPICSGCKSIRDSAGEWHAIEKYVADRTHAEFSHGICPKCVETYFPGIEISEKQ